MEHRADSSSVERLKERRGGVNVTHPGLWLLLGLALVLRVWNLSDKNMWMDESVSWWEAKSSVSDLVAQAAADKYPPLYYLLLKAWVWIAGDSLAAMRSLSVLCSMVMLYLLFRLIEGAMPRVVCYAVILWCALSPYELYLAQEARMYAPASAAVLGACLAYRRWIESGATRRSALVLYAISAVAALYLHYFTALAIAAIWLHFLIVGARTAAEGRTFAPWKAWIVANAGVAIAYAPWIPTAFAHLTQGEDGRQPVPLEEIPAFALELFSDLVFGYYLPPNEPVGALQLVVIGGVLAVGGWCLFEAMILRTGDERDVFFASVAYVPVLLALSLLPLSGWMDVGRAVPYASPLIVAAAARGWSGTGLAPSRVAGVLCACCLLLLPSVHAYYASSQKDSDVRPIVEYLLEHAEHAGGAASDPVFVAPGSLSTIMDFYSGYAIECRRVEGGADLGSVLEDSSTEGHEVWLVVDHRWPKFGDLDRDARMQPVDVPGGTPDTIRLLRLAPQ